LMRPLCLGPVCRDLTPVRGPHSLYCAACRKVLDAEQRKRANRRWLRKPSALATKRASTMRWYLRHRETELVRLRERSRQRRAA